MVTSDPATDPDVRCEYCSYCEKQTLHWCSDCFGCPQCCPSGEHCERCGQSQLMCDKTCCGGTVQSRQDQATRRIA